MMRAGDLLRSEKLDRIRTVVRDWKGGAISAPEAVARIARIVDVTLADDLPAMIEPDDPRLALRLVTGRERHGDGTETLALECGHSTTQLVASPAPDAERIRCVQCINALIEERRRK